MEKMAWTAASLGCEAVQVFSRSPRGGKAKPLDPSDVAASKAVREEKSIASCGARAVFSQPGL